MHPEWKQAMNEEIYALLSR